MTVSVLRKHELRKTEIQKVLTTANLVNESAVFMGGDSTPPEDFEHTVRFTVGHKKK